MDMAYHINPGSVTDGKTYYNVPPGVTNLDTTTTFNIVDGADANNILGTYVITGDATNGYVIEMTLDSSFDYTNGFDGTISVEGMA